MSASLCAICLDPLSTPLGSITPCGHCFHMDCMNGWRVRQERRHATCRCPMCNQTMQSHTRLYLELPHFLLEPAAVVVDGEESDEEEEEEDDMDTNGDDDDDEEQMEVEGDEKQAEETSTRRHTRTRGTKRTHDTHHARRGVEEGTKPRPAKKMKTRSETSDAKKPPATTKKAANCSAAVAAAAKPEASTSSSSSSTVSSRSTASSTTTTTTTIRQYQRRIRYLQKLLIHRTRQHLEVERKTMADVERVQQEVDQHKQLTEERLHKAEARLQRTEELTQAATRDIQEMKATYDTKIRMAELKLIEQAMKVQDIGQAHYTLLQTKKLEMLLQLQHQSKQQVEPVARRTRRKVGSLSTLSNSNATVPTVPTVAGTTTTTSQRGLPSTITTPGVQLSEADLQTMQQGLDELSSILNILQDQQQPVPVNTLPAMNSSSS